MGEVYRARDTRLGRDVAVKVIADDSASSPDRLHRFEQEARAVATLDHPHILSIHDVGTQDGTAYVVFELLEGETLRQRLERGPLPTRKAVELAIQICQGLAAAHARGIIHRDLKPENLFLTKDGRLKILDFGLAKLKDTPEREEELKKARTHTATEQGMLLGTVGYMSPEQARGQPADARSDLFAVGAILYEMLSGRRAFEGGTPADLLTAILTQEPAEISGHSGLVPAVLERLVRRCLEKDPEERFQSARDVAFALEALSWASRPGTEAVPVAVRPRMRWLMAGAVSVVFLTVGALIGLVFGRTVWERPLPTIKPLTFRRGFVNQARFTSDGKTVVYAGLWDGNPWEIFSTRMEGPESRSLGLPPAQLMSVSSRGELAILLIPPSGLGWYLRPGTLARVPLSGGALREVLGDVLVADWSADGRDLAVVRQVDGQFQLEYPIGRVLARPVAAWGGLRVSPHGDRVAINNWAEITLFDRAGKKTSVKTPPSVVGFAWARDDAIWFTAGETVDRLSLWRATIDGKTQELYRAPGAMVLLDVSEEGRVLVRHGIGRLGVRGKARGEVNERELGVFIWSGVTGLSDDGTQVLIGEGTGSSAAGAYVQSMRGGPPVRLSDGTPLALSPDAKWALVESREPKPPRLSLTPTGPGEPRLLPNHFAEFSGAWFMDSGHVFVDAAEAERPPRTFLIDLSGGETRPVTPEGMVAICGSYGGDSLLGFSEQAGGALTRVPLAGGQPQPMSVRLPDHASPIRVTADGRALFISQGDIPRRVDRFDLATGRVTPGIALRPDDLTGVLWVWPPAITPDGEAYAYSYSRFFMDLDLIEGLR